MMGASRSQERGQPLMVFTHIHLATDRKATQTGSHLDATEILEKGRANVLTPVLWTKKISIASCDPGRY